MKDTKGLYLRDYLKENRKKWRNKNMIFKSENKFRICSIHKVTGIDENDNLVISELGTEKGLAVEYEYEPNRFIVVSFIKIKDDEAYLEWVRMDVLNFEKDDLLNWQYMCKEAIKYVNGVLEILKED